MSLPPPATPVRPVPGAFVNTPAVVARFQPGPDAARRQLFPLAEGLGGGASPGPAASLAVAGPSEPGAATATPLPAPRAANVPPVARAAKAINACLQADEAFPDLDSYCRRETGARPLSPPPLPPRPAEGRVADAAAAARGRVVRL